MADSRSQMGFGQMGPQGQGQPGAYSQSHFNMMQQHQQQQHMAMMQHAQQQQHAQQHAQHMAPGNQMMMQQQQQQQQQQQAMMQQVGPGMPQPVMGAQQFPQQHMYAGQMPQQVPLGMYMLQGGQYVTAGFPPGAVPGQNYAVPPYTPQMAQQFKYKTEKMAARQAKQLEEQQRRIEAEHKARMFQDQQKRLKEFSAIGGRKMDADSLIKHIIGPDTKRPGASTQAPLADDNDGFGDFIQGPAVTDFGSGQPATHVHPAANKTASIATKQQQPQAQIHAEMDNTHSPPPPSQTPPASYTPPTTNSPPTTHSAPTAQPPHTHQEKKDLEKMMFASCDLTAPQKARTFQKRTLVKDAPKQIRQVTYQHSEKSRVWSGESEQLTELFTLPAPEPPLPPPQPATPELQTQGQVQAPAGQASPGQTGPGQPLPVPQGLPAWCMGETPLPDIYGLVLQASTREGRIQTNLVYAILVRSGLPREVLGAIWGMANTTMPGQLLPQELCAVLALIAIAQNNMAPAVEVLHRLPGPPVPNLGQGVPAATDPAAQQPAAGTPSQQTPPGTTALQPAAGAGTPGVLTPGAGNAAHIPGMAGIGTPRGESDVTEQEEFADFQDFQEALGGVQPSDSFGDFTAASPVNATTSLPGASSSSSAPVSRLPPITSLTLNATDLSATSSLLPTERKPAAGISVSIVSPEPLIGDEDKYSVFKHISAETVPPSTPDLFPSSAMNSDGKDVTPALPPPPASYNNTSATLPDVATFMGQASSKENFADFASATASDGFAEFQQEGGSASGSTPSGPGGVLDKLSALKALVSDTKTYKEKEEEKEEAADTGATISPGEEEWAEFSSIREVGSSCSEQLPPVKGDRYASLTAAMVNTPSVFAPQETNVFGVKPGTKQKDLFPADDSTEDVEEWGGFAESNTTTTNWADFSSPPVSLTPDSGSFGVGVNGVKQPSNDWALSSSKNESDLTNFGTLKPPEPLKMAMKDPDTDSGESSGVNATKPFSTTEKKFNYFARNLEAMNNGVGGAVSAGTGMSALDLEPPDLPDIKDDDDDAEDFDKFGTFHAVDDDVTASSGTGLSSLGAPFGGMDDVGLGVASTIDMFGYSSRPRTYHQPQKDSADSVSISSNEFNGWKVPGSSKVAKESSDTNSVNSLEFASSIKPAKSPKDGSPAGGDSQSVSSLEFGGGVDRKSVTPADERSIASLELKAVSTPEDAPVDALRPPANQEDAPQHVLIPEEDGFGEFSSATDAPKNGFKSNSSNMEYVQRPRAAHDVLRRGDMPSIVDRYSSLVQKQDEQDRHVREWERCLDKCRGMLEQGANSFTTISDVALCDEVLHSRQGTQYIQGVVEIYRVACRITEAMRAVSITNEKLVGLLKAIDTAWLDLVTLLSDTLLKPSPGRLDFSGAVLRAEDERAQEQACGICLLNVDWRGSQRSGATVDHKLTYGGRQYHAACANFWVNCVDSMLPALAIPELL